MATRLWSDWMNCGTLGVTENLINEPTVDATFRLVGAFDTTSGLNNVVGSVDNDTLTLTDAGNYKVSMFIKFEGSNKQFEFAMFINGVESKLKINDRATGAEQVSPIIPLPAGAVLDIRQRSVDGGTTLLIHYGGFSVSRLT